MESFNLDAPSAFDAPVIPVTEAPADTAAVANEPATGTQNPETAKPAEAKPVDESDRIIELSRKTREHEGKRRESESKAAAAEAKVKQLEPVVQLLNLAKTDPRSFLVEVADIVGLTPERVLDIMSTAGAGGDVALTAEDKITRLERELEELRNPQKPATEKPKADESAGAKARELDMAQATLEAAPEKFPLCADEPQATEAAFLVRVRHWEANGKDANGNTKPGYRPLSYAQALTAVESAIRAEIERKAERIGIKSTGSQAQPETRADNGGLSNRAMGAVNPINLDRAPDDSEIRSELLRALGL